MDDYLSSPDLTRVIHLAPPPPSSERKRITDFDWSLTTLGPLPTWQPSLRIALNMMLQSPFPCALVWGSDLTVIHNEEYSTLWPGGESGLGRSFEQLWRDHWQQVGPWAFRALAGQPSFIEDTPLHNGCKKGAGSAWHLFSYTPIHDDQGRVAGFLHKAINTTDGVEQLHQWRELAQGFERRINLYMADHDLLWRLSRDAMIIASRDLELLAANPAWYQVLGWEVDEIRALPLLDIVHPSDRNEVFLAIGELFQGVEVKGRQSRIRHRDGHYCWINWSARLAGEQLVAVGWEMTAAPLKASGTAYELNPLLVNVRDNLERLQRQLGAIPGQGQVSQVDVHLQQALEALQRAMLLSDEPGEPASWRDRS